MKVEEVGTDCIPQALDLSIAHHAIVNEINPGVIQQFHHDHVPTAWKRLECK
jgi:hypothetical protein